MKKLLILGVAALSLMSTSCNGHKHNYTLEVEGGWHTCIEGQDFNTEGLKVTLKCTDCADVKEVVDYELENNTALKAGQETIQIKYQDFVYNYPITVKTKYRIACVGDSLTAGHNWPNESYPSYLSKAVDDRYEVGNYGVNGISITGYGGSWDNPNQRYIKQDVYKNCVKFAPDIFAFMLGTNDATGWAKAEPTFDEYYHILLDSYIEQFPLAKFIMMVSPPTKDGNQFGIPNQTIKDEINPRQRDLADEYGFELLDLREEFEAVSDYESRYLRPNNDGVHFTVEAAEYVANRVWQITQELNF